MEKSIMKKQIIAAAVASSVSALALADISITGNAKYEYFNEQTGTAASTNKANTEVNLSIKGKKGDTSVVANLELNTHGDVSNGTVTATSTTASYASALPHSYATTTTISQRAGSTLDIEDLYMTTKVGDFTVKAGNYASGTSALLGEIDNGPRATNKVTVSTTVGGANVYFGNSGRGDTGESAVANTALDNNMFAGISMDVAGNTVQFKKVKENSDGTGVDAWGIAGSAAGVSYRLEQKMDSADNGDVTFGEVKTSMSGLDLGYAWIDADKKGKVTEDDSSIFAVEMATSGGVARTEALGVKQITASTTVDGNKITLKSGSVEHGLSATKDLDYMQIGVSRALASGANAVVTYTSKDASASDTTETDTLEVELNVSF
jgi:hypothetical protein